jgi:hypothetical protein
MRGVLVFCEGNHDVAFVSRSLGALVEDAHFVKGPISGLPAPFGTKKNPKHPKQAASKSVIERRYLSRDMRDLELSDATHAPTPVFDRVVALPADDTLYVIMRCGSDRAARPVLELLEDIRAVMAVVLDLDALALAFVLDADDAGVGAREDGFSRDYAACLAPEQASPIHHAQWGQGRDGPVGLFVFHDPGTGTGGPWRTCSIHWCGSSGPRSGRPPIPTCGLTSSKAIASAALPPTRRHGWVSPVSSSSRAGR